MNCKLYQKECTQTGARKSTIPTIQQADDSSLDMAQTSGSNQNAISSGLTSASDHEHPLSEQNTTPGARRGGNPMDGCIADLETSSCRLPSSHSISSPES